MFLIGSIVISMLMNGCSTKCDPFPEKLNIFSPCGVNERMVFVHQDNDSLVFECSSMKVGGDESIPFGCKCECSATMDKTYTGEYKIRESFSVLNGEFVEYNFRIDARPSDGTTYSHDGYSESYYLGKSGSIPQWLSWDTVLLCQKDTRFDSLILVKGEGVHSFLDRERGWYVRVL